MPGRVAALTLSSARVGAPERSWDLEYRGSAVSEWASTIHHVRRN